MNIIPIITKVFGLRENEAFRIEGYQDTYRFSKDRLECQSFNTKSWVNIPLDSPTLTCLIIGTAHISRLPFSPDEGERYFYIVPSPTCDPDNLRIVSVTFAMDCYLDRHRIKIGNCFRSADDITPEIMDKFRVYLNDLTPHPFYEAGEN